MQSTYPIDPTIRLTMAKQAVQDPHRLTNLPSASSSSASMIAGTRGNHHEDVYQLHHGLMSVKRRNKKCLWDKTKPL